MFVDTFNTNQLHITIKNGEEWIDAIATREDLDGEQRTTGSKVPTPWKVVFNGRKYRIYSDCSKNVSKDYILVNKVKNWIH